MVVVNCPKQQIEMYWGIIVDNINNIIDISQILNKGQF